MLELSLLACDVFVFLKTRIHGEIASIFMKNGLHYIGRNHGKGNKYWRALKYFYLRFIRLRGDPHELALGMALGVFAGSMPILPFQTALAIFLALVFKSSKIAAMLGTWISNPLNWYFLYFYSYKIGAGILGLSGTGKVFHSIMLSIHQGESAWILFEKMVNAGGELMAAFLVGGLALGLVFSVPSYFIFIGIFRSLRGYRDRLRREKFCPEDHL
jgi:uncharacterized protein (DUF2062 family)